MPAEFPRRLGADGSAAPAFGLSSVLVPRAGPSDLAVVMDQLFELFPDHEPVLSAESADDWVFRLELASSARQFVDSGVQSTVKSLYGMELADIGGHHEILHFGSRDVVISFIHSWALLAVSRALVRGTEALNWVVHFDDHTDLMGSLLEPADRPGCLRDSLFGVDVDIRDPHSVIEAVTRGSINKGNFLTAYLLAHAGCRVIHIGSKVAEQHSRLVRHVETVGLGGRRLLKQGFELHSPCESEAWTFGQSRAFPMKLPIGRAEAIWLDIDCDYFSNRFNGDSDRRVEVAGPGEHGEVMGRIREFLSHLGSARWLPNIAAVSIALSPGFFPAEYWAEARELLCEGLRGLLDT